MTYTPQDINRFIQEHDNVETKVLCIYWSIGDNVDAFREDCRRLKNLFVHLNYAFIKEYAIPEANSQSEMEREIWKHLCAFQDSQSVFIIYYGGHGEKGGKGRWVAHDKIGQEPSVEWQSIQKQLGSFRGKVLVIIDACFAGSAMRSADDYDISLCNIVGLQRGPKKTDASVVPGNVELWLATSFHGQTPLKEPTFTQAVVRTLEHRLADTGMSITVSRAHKAMIELDSNNKLQCQPIYQPLENPYQKSIEIHHFDITKPMVEAQSPSTLIDMRLQLDTLDEETMPMLIQWLNAHPSNVISRECQSIETYIRAAHQYVSQNSEKSPPKNSLAPFQHLSDSLKQRTLDAYQNMTRSALALLSVNNVHPTVVSPSPKNELKAKTASQDLQGAWTRFKAQIQQNIVLGPDNNEEDEVLQLMEDPEIRKMGLSQMLRMRLLAMRNNEEPAHYVKSPSLAGSSDMRSEGPLFFLNDGIHAFEYKSYPENIGQQLRTIHETRLDRLAKVLKEASLTYDTTSPSDFLTLKCLGYFSESSKHRFGLKFELPCRHESSPEPITLWRALKSGKKYRLPLQQRLSLAQKISKALLNWHLAGWHHQEISSRNIVFFSSPASPEPDYTSPYLCGFDFSRESGQISATKDAKDMEFSIYRHPDRQFDTTLAHMLRHDIYSLGVVLLDLGLWDDPDESWKNTIKTKPVNNDQAKDVYKRLWSFPNRLSFYVGSHYAEAVRNCLNDALFDTTSDRGTTDIFIDKILNKLHSGEGL